MIAVFGPVTLVADPSLLALAGAVTGVVAFAALAAYVRSDLVASLREDPDRARPDLGGLVALAVLVGALGGLTTGPGEPDRESDSHIWIGL